jgi:hypothetical protein
MIISVIFHLAFMCKEAKVRHFKIKIKFYIGIDYSEVVKVYNKHIGVTDISNSHIGHH